MKKIYSVTIILLLFSSVKTEAQDKDMAYIKGSSTFSAGYGLFNIWKILLSGIEKTTATGPLSLTYQYGISKKISAGIALGYSLLKGSYEDKLTGYSIVVLGNYHFGHSKKFDPYAGVGGGYYNLKYVSPANFGVINPDTYEISGQAGVKYYFTSYIGIYAELDLVNGYVEGSFPQLGLTYIIK